MAIGQVRHTILAIMTSPCIYILKCANDRFYIGSTNNLLRRFEEHERGHVASTKNLRPLMIAFSQNYPSLLEARKIELKLKKLKSRTIIEKIISEKQIKLSSRSSAG